MKDKLHKIPVKRRIFVQSNYIDVQGVDIFSYSRKKEKISIYPQSKKLPKLSPEDLSNIKREVFEIYKKCSLCPLNCGVNRLSGEKGICGVGPYGKIYKSYVDWGIEGDLSPSLNLYFSGCNLRCPFCQEIDDMLQVDNGVSIEKIDSISYYIIKKMEDLNCRTLLFVGGEPTLSLLFSILVIEKLHYNKFTDIAIALDTNLYVNREITPILEKFVDVFIVDLKFTKSLAEKFLTLYDYWEAVTQSIKYIYQNKNSTLVIRHLVIPGLIEGNTLPIIDWIKENTPEAYVSILTTFHPLFRSKEMGWNRPLSEEERIEVLTYLNRNNLNYVMSEVEI